MSKTIEVKQTNKKKHMQKKACFVFPGSSSHGPHVLCWLILISALQGKCYHLQFVDDETEEKREERVPYTLFYGNSEVGSQQWRSDLP